MELTVLCRVCEWCGRAATLQCARRACGVHWCSAVCQRSHWENGHRELCTALIAWFEPEPSLAIEGPLDFLRRKDAPASERKPPAFVRRYQNPPDKSGEVVAKLTDPAAPRPASEPTLLDDKHPQATEATEKAAERGESQWKEQKGSAVKQVLSEMRHITKLAKERKLDEPKPLPELEGANSSLDLVKRFASKVALAGFKVAFAGGKVAAGTGAETATVVGIPLDTLIDAIAVALDVMLFATTVLESVYGIFRGFVEIKDNLALLLTFSGGVPGVQAAVDALFDLLDKLGLKRRAQQFIGSIIELFERFVRWAAPVIGSVIGLAIPYDASIVGRVVEFFLYPIKFFITEGWLLISKLWGLLPGSWQEMLSSREKWNELLVSFVDLIKRLFPVDENNNTWKSRLIDKAGKIGVKLAYVHPLVVVGVLSRDRVDKTAANVVKVSKDATQFFDSVVSRWIDNVVIPNIDKISMLVQASLGLGFGFIYMLHAYTPDGTRKKLGIGVSLDDDARTTLQRVAAHLGESATARAAFVADKEARFHEAWCITNRAAREQYFGLLLATAASQNAVP